MTGQLALTDIVHSLSFGKNAPVTAFSVVTGVRVWLQGSSVTN